VHELTEKMLGQLEDSDWRKRNADKIITDWLKEKANELLMSCRVHDRKNSDKLLKKQEDNINRILCILGESLEDKFKEVSKNMSWNEYYEGLVRIAQDHFKAHPEELE